ncbi:hypothetical protein J610_1744 [Acinetobacter sp. 723929]|nr:hypothetical protein J508_1534 [Acinetobacter sp. 1289694]EXB79351.1 hypothetical protein J551_0539 [Acinetobacter sp. 1475718]EXI17083.1 hypothetical protein J610_1744 [Acinetobacter sp. 723929]EXS01617.1 hypothetical protein J687_1193 [Acinetobacter sp. 225588]EYT45971.1 hypothetical protein J619_01569 [Acinetobacter sp. 478810]KCX64029.1 hypothetical protein J541_0384 [Acinetobacter pittii]KCX97870.1 hypothetical protein J584_1678 [Acinetobacter sp. 72431]KCY16206.1 hypothetical protei
MAIEHFSFLNSEQKIIEKLLLIKKGYEKIKNYSCKFC